VDIIWQDLGGDASQAGALSPVRARRRLRRVSHYSELLLSVCNCKAPHDRATGHFDDPIITIRRSEEVVTCARMGRHPHGMSERRTPGVPAMFNDERGVGVIHEPDREHLLVFDGAARRRNDDRQHEHKPSAL
jgi:hypothetical protein